MRRVMVASDSALLLLASARLLPPSRREKLGLQDIYPCSICFRVHDAASIRASPVYALLAKNRQDVAYGCDLRHGSRAPNDTRCATVGHCQGLPAGITRAGECFRAHALPSLSHLGGNRTAGEAPRRLGCSSPQMVEWRRETARADFPQGSRNRAVACWRRRPRLVKSSSRAIEATATFLHYCLTGITQ